MLESSHISVEQQLKVFYGLAFIATQAAERSKDLLAAGSVQYVAARHARNFIQHPPSFTSAVCNETLKNIIIALEELSSSTDPQSIFESIHRDFELLLTQTPQLKKKQSKEEQLVEIVKQAKGLCMAGNREERFTNTSAIGGAVDQVDFAAGLSATASPDQFTITSTASALQGVYVHLANLLHDLLHDPKLKKNDLVKQLESYTVLSRQHRNFSAHGIQPLTDEELQLFVYVMTSIKI